MNIKYDYFHKINNGYYKMKTKIWYKLFLKSIGKNSTIRKPLKINNPQYIDIGSNVGINKMTWLLAVSIDEKIPNLKIDDNTTIGHYNHITCINKVYIGKNVLTADKVYISDNYHGYEDISIPISLQKVKSKGEVSIGENTWIGENVAVISCKIGKHCIIGANSVVNKDIPDYCVAVGSPARVVKKFNVGLKKWEKVSIGENL